MFYIHSNQSMPILATYNPNGGIKIKATALNQDLGNSFSKSIVEQKDPRFVYAIARAVTAEVPNKNWDLFPMEEIQRAYPTFVGRNIFLDHNTQSVRNAVGKIVAAELRQDDEGYTYVACLFKVDRQIHPDIAMKIEDGIIDSVSMGANVKEAECSVCHHRATRESEFCEHLANLGRYIDPYTGQPNYSINHGVEFTELSLVSVPADPTAKMHKVFNQQGGIDKTAEDQSDNVVPPSNVEENVVVDAYNAEEHKPTDVPANTGEYVEAVNRDTGFYQLDCSSPEKADFFYYILEPYINKGIVELDVTDKTVKILFAPNVDNPEKFVEDAVSMFGLTMTTGVVLPEKEAAYKETLKVTASKESGVICGWLDSTKPVGISISTKKGKDQDESYTVKLSFGKAAYEKEVVDELISYLVGEDGITNVTNAKTAEDENGNLKSASFTLSADKWNVIHNNFREKNPGSKFKANAAGLKKYISEMLQYISNDAEAGEDRSELPKNTYNVANQEPTKDLDFDFSAWGEEKPAEAVTPSETPATDKPEEATTEAGKMSDALKLKDKLNKFVQGSRKTLPSEVKDILDAAAKNNVKSSDLDLSALPPEVHEIVKTIYIDKYGAATGEQAERRNTPDALKDLDKAEMDAVQTAGHEANTTEETGAAEAFNAEQMLKGQKPKKKTKRQLEKEDEEFKALLPKVNEAIALAMTDHLSKNVMDVDNEALKADFNKAIDDTFSENPEFADKYRSEYGPKVIKQIKKQFTAETPEEKKAVKALFADKPAEEEKPKEEAPKVDEKYEAFKTEVSEEIKQILADGISGNSNPSEMANAINDLLDKKGLKNPEYSEKVRGELAPEVQDALKSILPGSNADAIATAVGNAIKNGTPSYPEDFEVNDTEVPTEEKTEEPVNEQPTTEEKTQVEDTKPAKKQKVKVNHDDPELLVKRVSPEMFERLMRSVRKVVENKLNKDYNGIFPGNKDELVNMALNIFGTLLNTTYLGNVSKKYTPEQIRNFLQAHEQEFLTLGMSLGSEKFGQAFYAASLKKMAPLSEKQDVKEEQKAKEVPEVKEEGKQKQAPKSDQLLNADDLPEFDIGPNRDFHLRVLSLKREGDNFGSNITKGFEFALNGKDFIAENKYKFLMKGVLTPNNKAFGTNQANLEIVKKEDNTFSYSVTGKGVKGQGEGSAQTLQEAFTKIFEALGVDDVNTNSDDYSNGAIEHEFDLNEFTDDEIADFCAPDTGDKDIETTIKFNMPDGKSFDVARCLVKKAVDGNDVYLLYVVDPLVDALSSLKQGATIKGSEAPQFLSSLKDKLDAWATDAKKLLLTNKENKK